MSFIKEITNLHLYKDEKNLILSKVLFRNTFNQLFLALFFSTKKSLELR